MYTENGQLKMESVEVLAFGLWTYTKLASDSTVSTTAFANVSGMSFSVDANTTYLVELMGAYQTAATTTGIGLALDVPTGAEVVGQNIVSTSATAPGGTQAIVTTNEGATALVTRTLPSAVAGNIFRFACMDTDGIKVVAGSGDEIMVIDKVTAAAGYIQSTTIGSYVELVAMNATTWLATVILGVWTDGTFTYDDTSLTTP